MSNEMMRIGVSGIYANQIALNIAGNNITNVNTDGYSRQRVEFTAEVLGGIDRVTVHRMMDQFAQAQLRKDTTSLGFADAYLTQANRTDKLLGDTSNGLSTGIENLFARINTMNNEASSISNRELVLSDFGNMLENYQRQAEQFSLQQKEVNQQLTSYSEKANGLIGSIFGINQQLAAVGNTQNGSQRSTLLDQRDEYISQLSELMDIQVTQSTGDAVNVTMANGMALVLPDSRSTVQVSAGDPETRRLEMSVTLGTQTFEQKVADVGGKLGGLGSFRQDVLEPAQRQLGQMALAMADAFNKQNNLGLDLNGNLGGDIFKLPTLTAFGMKDNSSADHLVTAQVTDGTQLTDQDYQIVFTTATDYEVQALDSSGKVTGTLATGTLPAPANVDGLQIDFSAATPPGAFAAGDTFVLHPTRDAINLMDMAMDRPEELALASPIAVNKNASNLGSATVSSIDVTNVDPATSGFATTSPVALDATAPGRIVFLSDTQYQLYDQGGTAIGGPTNFDSETPIPEPPLDYGFSIKLSGTPAAGDEFTLGVNLDSATGAMTAKSDNNNGLKLAQLQTAEIVRQNEAGATTVIGESLTTAFSSLVSNVGDKTGAMRVKQEAAQALHDESQGRLQAVAGVNLDEEAANLIQFQQAYSATARILSTAQNVFDNLLQAIG
ncbi:flagellar hook-associated protein FlgK [Gallaecimonas xiamenensis]|uniref:Flagellar hook-associated protein 1 n=1 Tax=Gallaecimonas xiamenensis 3-C-1 TaxID=745411 RepID=K2IY90_9GAMM|nr:flagellar hook-associated protein FlgK [Gallaecimonas xiamenensis]EKE75446.1 flagellar hook-associated protein FlgK [Gallaecimonas xiamenensis 3-C-1]